MPSLRPRFCRVGRLLVGLVMSLVTISSVAEEARPSGDAVLRAPYADSEIVITTTSRLAGAIHSVTWRGREFIDSHDHGRQLQSAASFDVGRFPDFWAECFNPTEAGSRADGAGPTSRSRLLRLEVGERELRTTTQMAFWLAPGERSEGRLALNQEVLSGHRLSKRVRLGVEGWPNVFDYEVTFSVPEGEAHTYGQFEALTGYMPPEFRQFSRLDPTTETWAALDDGPGEQRFPVIFSTDGGTHAMGVYAPGQPSPGYEEAGYGRFRFPRERVVKWNCVFRERRPAGLPAGDYRYQVYVAIGTLEGVRETLLALARRFPGK